MFSALVYAWHGPATHCLTATDSSFNLMSLDVSVEFSFAQAMTIFTALSSLPTLGRPGWVKFAWQVLLWADNFKKKQQTYFTIEAISPHPGYSQVLLAADPNTKHPTKTSYGPRSHASPSSSSAWTRQCPSHGVLCVFESQQLSKPGQMLFEQGQPLLWQLPC